MGLSLQVHSHFFAETPLNTPKYKKVGAFHGRMNPTATAKGHDLGSKYIIVGL
jgi:hypothetical protein